MEQAASDPQMMKEVERMAKLPVEDRGLLQRIQEGLSGTAPMDETWIDQTIGALKKKPALFKNMMKGKGAMLGGVTDEQVNSFIDMLSGMDVWTLKTIVKALLFLGSLYQPALQLYSTVDKYTLGCAKYIALAIFAIVSYYSLLLTWTVLRWFFVLIWSLFSSNTSSSSSGVKLPVATDTTASTGSSSPITNQASSVPSGSADSEFEF